MRSIFVGIEYAGKSTLIKHLQGYYHRRKLPTHGDDHFTIPDATLSPKSRALMVNFPDDIKENYRAQRIYEAQVFEARLPDVVMIHVTASDEAIRERMKANPHEYQIIKEKDIPEIKRRFEEEVEKSLFTQKGRKIVLDTTNKTPQESLDELLLLSEPLITFGELALRALPIPEGDYQVKYEDGVRKMVS
ncbi:hypothetical protein HYR99_23420 [Candidatus Poribacteria bacterium]|nr:hypothetical protein [Candidatus Poribacteria bacterium]